MTDVYKVGVSLVMTGNYAQVLGALTPEGANDVAKRLILPNHLVWVVVGDMRKVETGIRELNLGEIRKIDADGNPIPDEKAQK